MNSKQKNNATADKLRSSGNECFSKSEYFFALLNYNQSLCFAETGSEQMGLAYANRSAVYQLAKTSKYPKSRIDKLEEREEKCKELMKTSKPNPDDDPFNFFKISYPTNKKYPGIVDCIELRNNKKFGDHLITTKALKTGDVIAIEDPSFTVTFPCSRLHRCSYCCKDIRLNLIPCPGCSQAMFCSTRCCLDASNEGHKFECNLELERNVDFAVPPYMRMLLKYLNLFDGNVVELKKFLEANKKPVTVFDFDFSDQNDPMYKKNMMLVVPSFRNTSKMAKFTLQASKTASKSFINRDPKLKELWRQHGSFLNDLLEKLAVPSCCAPCEAFGVSKPINLQAETAGERTLKDFLSNTASIHMEVAGSALYPAASLLNGSCDPNVGVYLVSNKNVLVVSKPIPAGAQLFRQYAYSFYAGGPAHVRQKTIEAAFGFKCDCEACKYDWPTGLRLPAMDPSYTEELTRSLSTQEQAKENIKKYTEYIEMNYQHNKPTKEVYVCINNIIFEYFSLAKPSFYP